MLKIESSQITFKSHSVNFLPLLQVDVIKGRIPNIMKRSLKETVRYNSRLNRERQEERCAYFDLQTQVYSLHFLVPWRFQTTSPYSSWNSVVHQIIDFAISIKNTFTTKKIQIVSLKPTTVLLCVSDNFIFIKQKKVYRNFRKVDSYFRSFICHKRNGSTIQLTNQTNRFIL